MEFHELFQRANWAIPELWSAQWSVWVFLQSADNPQKNSFRIITDNDAEAFSSKELPIFSKFSAYNFGLFEIPAWEQLFWKGQHQG